MTELDFIALFFSCAVVWRAGHDHTDLSYISYIYILGFVLPLVVISSSYFNIIKQVFHVQSLKLTKVFDVLPRITTRLLTMAKRNVNCHKTQTDQISDQRTRGLCLGLTQGLKSDKKSYILLSRTLRQKLSRQNSGDSNRSRRDRHASPI